MNLENQIEAVLFYKNEPLEIRKLAKLLGKEEREVRVALADLAKSLENRGICLIMTETEAALATAIGMKNLIEQIAKDEMSREIGRAGLETLAIILYNQEISRREIDYIRGVNSSFVLRNLAMRGLVEKEQNPKDQRTFRYKASLSLLAHLGIKTVSELPGFKEFKANMNKLTTKIDTSDE